jgi:hypothetical protein
MLTLICLQVGMLASIAVFPSERKTFFHEYLSSGRQSTATFLLSYTILEVPMQVQHFIFLCKPATYLLTTCQGRFLLGEFLRPTK